MNKSTGNSVRSDVICCHSDGNTGLTTISQGDHSFIMDKQRRILWASDGIQRSSLNEAFERAGGKEFLQRLVEEGKDGKSTVVTVDLEK